MKRIQRETLSDVRKLKEKHDEIEHILSLYKTGKGLELLDLPIQVKIALDATGALFLVGDDGGNEFERARADLDKAGRRTGLRSRFVFESKTRGKADTIAAELSTQLGASAGHHIGRPVELTRLHYSARVNRWLSLTLVPFGARCTNFLHSSSMIQVCMVVHLLLSLDKTEPCSEWTDEIKFMGTVGRIYGLKPLSTAHRQPSSTMTAALA